MNPFLTSFFSSTTANSTYYLLAIAGTSVLGLSLLKRVKRKFLAALLVRKKSKHSLRRTKGGRILLVLLIILATSGLFGLLLGWTAALIMAGVLGLMSLVYFLNGEKSPAPGVKRNPRYNRKTGRYEY